MCAEKFPLVLMGGRAEGLACADLGARTPIGASGNFIFPLLSVEKEDDSLALLFLFHNGVQADDPSS